MKNGYLLPALLLVCLAATAFAEEQTLYLRAIGTQQYRVSVDGATCANVSSQDAMYTPRLAEVQLMAEAGATRLSGGLLGNHQVRKFYYDPAGNAAPFAPGASISQRSLANPANYAGLILFRPEGYDCYLWRMLAPNEADGSTNYVLQYFAGQPSRKKIYMPTAPTINADYYVDPPAGFDREIVLREEFAIPRIHVLSRVPIVTTNVQDANFRFRTATSPERIYYKGIVNRLASARAPGFRTAGNTVYVGTSTTEVTFTLATRGNNAGMVSSEGIPLPEANAAITPAAISPTAKAS
jgi:hypothetical protein